jgi:uncharacterized protein (TIGR02118 family)
MLRQLIFAAPKPGMSVQDFQDYWVHKHAVQYASKIPQVRRYSIDTMLPDIAKPDPPLFAGCAEIWVDDAEAVVAALQSPEYLQGARMDEPNWAAFWMTVALVTETHVMLAGPPDSRDSTLVKVMMLVKRKGSLEVADFHRYALEQHAPKLLNLPGLRRQEMCLVPEMFYATAETPYDGVFMAWFDDIAAAQAALTSPVAQSEVIPDEENFLNPKYLHLMVAREHWIIGP